LKASQLCEAQDCDAKATLEVEVNAGTHGKIPLNLCARCVGKFEIIKEEGSAPLKGQIQNGTVYGETADNKADGQANNVINT
jgi:hypothetical protein